MMKPDPLPNERDGYCVGCKAFKRLFIVSPWRYRCIECIKQSKT